MTGQTVVEMGIVEVTTTVESAGQSVIEAAQLVTVTSLVVYTVEVTIRTMPLPAGEVVPAADEPAADEPAAAEGEETP